MTMLTIAKALQAALIQDVREDQTTFIKLAPDAPEWMTLAVREAHEGRLPNDTDYSAFSEVVDAIVEALEGDEDMDDARHERCDGLVPIYNNDRINWMAQHSDYVGYCDDARMEGLVSNDAAMVERIGAGYYQYYSNLWGYALTAITEAWEQEDDSEGEDE